MGSQMLAAVDSPSPAAAESLANVPERFAAWERRLTSFSEESELSELNRSHGRPVRVSDVLWNVVTSALQAAQLTSGLVSPAVVPALDEGPRRELGYGRTFESIERDSVGARGATVAAMAVADWRGIKLDPRKRTILLPEGLRIDLGGIAKGWAADRVAAILGRQGPALVDVGGDIAVSGPMAGGSHWPIGVYDPLRDGEQLDLIMLRSGGVATSGRDYRKWRQDGVRRVLSLQTKDEDHHIIDPRTGELAGTDVLSATVVARSAQEAEVAARVALILGSIEGMAWIDARSHLAGLLVLEDGRVLRSRLFKYYLYE